MSFSANKWEKRMKNVNKFQLFLCFSRKIKRIGVLFESGQRKKFSGHRKFENVKGQKMFAKIVDLCEKINLLIKNIFDRYFKLALEGQKWSLFYLWFFYFLSNIGWKKYLFDFLLSLAAKIFESPFKPWNNSEPLFKEKIT